MEAPVGIGTPNSNLILGPKEKFWRSHSGNDSCILGVCYGRSGKFAIEGVVKSLPHPVSPSLLDLISPMFLPFLAGAVGIHRVKTVIDKSNKEAKYPFWTLPGHVYHNLSLLMSGTITTLFTSASPVPTRGPADNRHTVIFSFE